jgi:hypothetical protein
MSYAAGKIKTFSCPNCSGSVTIHAVGISITAICKHCGCTIDVANENLKVIKTASSQTRQPFISIGLRVNLFDVDWEVIGYMEREIKNTYGTFSWEEYLLFNPWQGFRFLVCSDNHWTFVKTLHQDIKEVAINRIECNGQEYKLFAKDTAKVTYVLGEFYWRAKVNETTRVSDFISPPYVISKEETNDEVVWSQGIYVEPELIKQALKLSLLPAPEGIAPHQPSPITEHLPVIKRLSVIFFSALVITQFALMGLAENKTIFSQKIHTILERKEQVIVSEPIEMTGRKSNVQITLSSPVDNNWLELNTALINDETQQTFNATQVVEYYHGADEDGSWSEGSQTNETLISAVPAGKYRLLLTPDTEKFNDSGTYVAKPSIDFDVTVKHGVPTSANFFMALLALLLPFSIIWYRNYSFEKRRWEDSDYEA